MDLDPVEVRILGCLIEKQRTTPDQYPLSLNALRLACNQTTNRDPVVNYDEDTIRGGLHHLSRRRYTRLASGHSSRASKYRHLLDDELHLDPAEQAVLAVLMLRGPQTPGELKQRTERMQGFASIEELEEVLTRLIDKQFVHELARRPGQKEERFQHRLSEDLDDEDGGAPVVAQAPAAVVVPPPPRRDERMDRLEAEVASLREEIAAIKAELGYDAMLDHVGFAVSDYARSKAFYTRTLAPLGTTLVLEPVAEAAGFGSDGKPFFWIESRGKPVAGRLHIAFAVDDRATVDAFHAAGLAAGGTDNGAPGVREIYHPNYYGAYLLDPDGHNIEAVCHRPA